MYTYVAPTPHSTVHTFVAAGVAAAGELSIMQPLDVVKTRLQMPSSCSSSQQQATMTTTWTVLRQIYFSDGLVGLWRGFGPGLGIVVPRRGLKFALNGLFVSWLGGNAAGALVAGGAAGACEAVVITPLEVIKVQMQSHDPHSPGQRRSMGRVAVRLWQRGGIRTLYTGLWPTVCKHSVHSCVYFASFGQCQPRARGALQSRVQGDLASGFVAGCAAGAVNNPFDVLKSRVQASAHMRSMPRDGDAPSTSVLRGLAHIIRHEGAGTLFAGLGAKVCRLGPGSAIIFAVYHAVLDRL